jgi:SAM-dependent methyltransferase
MGVWARKPLLQKLYAQFYQCILGLIDPNEPGLTVELGSGIGNLKQHLPHAVCTNLFAQPWIDLVCDAYELPFASQSVSHLVLFDVFHHLSCPKAFLHEARRVLRPPQGRLILFEPYISVSSYLVYGLGHHEPVAWWQPIDASECPPSQRGYFAAQGNATRLFFRDDASGWLTGWMVLHAQPMAAFSYLFSGGYSKPALYPVAWLENFQRLDRKLSHWPRLFGARCLVALSPRP